MSAVFLDTGYLIALEAADDQNHPAADRHWSAFRKSLPPLVTTSFVLAEVVTFFNSRKRHEKAVELGRMLVASPAISLIHVDETLFHRGWEFFQQRPDKTYSLTDCISFLVMQDQNITQALALDQHFVQAGFQKLPWVRSRFGAMCATKSRATRQNTSSESSGSLRLWPHAIEAMGEVRGGSVGEGEDAAGGGVGADRNPVQQVGGGFDDVDGAGRCDPDL